MSDDLIPQEPVVDPTVPEVTPVAETPPAVVLDPTIEAATLIAGNSDLLTQINSMMQVAPPQVLPTAQVVPPASIAPPAASGAEGFQFDNAIIDDVVTDPMAFANHVAQTVFDRMSQQAPAIVDQQLSGYMQQEEQAQQVFNQFYGANPELVGQEQIVGAVAGQLEQQYPTLNVQQLMQLTAQTMKIRSTNMQVTEQHVGNETITPMATQGMGGNVVPVITLPEADQDMADMLKDADAGTTFF